jgi:hypothetical protein
MVRVIVDQATLAKLHNLTEALELSNESGQLLGYYTPAHNRGRPRYDQTNIPSFREEDLKRWEEEPGGRSLAEILSDLEKRV